MSSSQQIELFEFLTNTRFTFNEKIWKCSKNGGCMVDQNGSTTILRIIFYTEIRYLSMLHERQLWMLTRINTTREYKIFNAVSRLNHENNVLLYLILIDPHRRSLALIGKCILKIRYWPIFELNDFLVYLRNTCDFSTCFFTCLLMQVDIKSIEIFLWHFYLVTSQGLNPSSGNTFESSARNVFKP